MFKALTSAKSNKGKGTPRDDPSSPRKRDKDSSVSWKRGGKSARSGPLSKETGIESPRGDFKRAIAKSISREGKDDVSPVDEEGGLLGQGSGGVPKIDTRSKTNVPRTISQSSTGSSTSTLAFPSGVALNGVPRSTTNPQLLPAGSSTEQEGTRDAPIVEGNPIGSDSKTSSRSNSLPNTNSPLVALSPTSTTDVSPRTDTESPPPTFSNGLDLVSKEEELFSLQKICDDVQKVTEALDAKKVQFGPESTLGKEDGGIGTDDVSTPSAPVGVTSSDHGAAARQPESKASKLEASVRLSGILADEGASKKVLEGQLQVMASKEEEGEKLRRKLLAEINALRRENLEMQAMLESRSKGEEMAVASLRKELMRLMKDKASIEEQQKAEIAALQSQIDAASEEKEGAEEELVLIQREKAALDEQLASVSLRAASAANGSLRVANERRSLVREIDELKRELAAAKAEIGALIDEKMALENENWSQFALRKWSGGVCGSYHP